MDWIKGKFLVTKEGNKYLAVLHNRNNMVNAFASHILLRRLRAPIDWHVLVVFASLVLGRQL